MNTNDDIFSINERGSGTLPINIRQKISVRHFVCKIEKGNRIVLEPLQTREEFYAELEAAEKDWEKNGGITLEEFAKKYDV
ncbi:hypothetical protein COV82_04055 [Candidatus Peregrinibacteria bacterium CG11_big_fil_rev_8_21_14_0_20_46_8]|nr:MAG: hypothetical protein COV82_04055 [Candidatus Peregrinibacteria bacterium CG11_big_fil_rev_8_21_14_0_20_46_8]